MARTRKWLVRRVGVLVVLAVLGMVAGVWYVPDAHAASDPGPNLIIPPGPGGGACLTFGKVTWTVADVLTPQPGIPNGSIQAKGSVTNNCGVDVTNAKVVTDSSISNCAGDPPLIREFSSAGTGLSAGMTLIFTATVTGLCYSCNVFHIPSPQPFRLTTTILATATEPGLQMVTASNPPTGGPTRLIENDQSQLPFPC